MQHKPPQYVLHFRPYSMHLRITDLSHLLCCRFIFYDKMRRSKNLQSYHLISGNMYNQNKTNRLCIRIYSYKYWQASTRIKILDTREAWSSRDIGSSIRGTHGAINLGWISRVLEDPMPQGQAALRWRSLFSICITLTYYNKWQSRLDHGNTNTVARLSAER